MGFEVRFRARVKDMLVFRSGSVYLRIRVKVMVMVTVRGYWLGWVG